LPGGVDVGVEDGEPNSEDGLQAAALEAADSLTC
jgi:hypothetical protein